MNKALLSSKNMCWCTPQDFFGNLCSTPRQRTKQQNVLCSTRLKWTDSRKVGIAAALSFAIHHMAGKLASGCGKPSKRHAGGIQSFHLSQHERIHLIFTTTSMGRRKSDSCVGVCALQMKTEMSLILRRFRLW